MKRRIKKKKIKQIKKFVQENQDYIDYKCAKCKYFEKGDMSVGLADGCTCYALYDENDEIIKEIDDKIAEHMNWVGYTCPYFNKKKRR